MIPRLELVVALSPLRPSTTSSVDRTVHPAVRLLRSLPLAPSQQPLYKTNVDACQSLHLACLVPLPLKLHLSPSALDEAAFLPIVPTPSMRVQSMMTTAPLVASLQPLSHDACPSVHKHFEHEQLVVAQEQMVDPPLTLQHPRQMLHYPQSQRVPEAEE
jgi:hypothetical protein